MHEYLAIEGRIDWRAAGRILASALVLIFLLAAALGFTTPALSDGLPQGPRGHTLIMIDDPGCIYCARWRAEVGPGYVRSAEGRFAPLAVVRRGEGVARRLTGIRYTPTFVLVEAESEIGRIVGYGGEHAFWSQLEVLLLKAGLRPEQPAAPPEVERETRLHVRPFEGERSGAAEPTSLN